MKKIKIMIELDSNWLEEERGADLLAYLGEVKRRFEDKVFEKAVEKAVNGLDIPKIKVSKEELKKAVLEVMAERVLDK